jgi:tRNA dimethylallyltransferase
VGGGAAGPRLSVSPPHAVRDFDPPLTVVVIGGPTASGKSTLALALAAEFRGTVINADSMQLYRELPVLTAQPTPAQREAVPHRLYGVRSIDDPCSAAQWATLARAEIEAAGDAGRLPIVVGGTGLYLRALVSGLAPIPEIPGDIRAAARERVARDGLAAAHAELARRDPLTAARIDPADRQRIARALEVLEATGRPLAEWHRQQPESGDGPRHLAFVLSPPRAFLAAACNRRFEVMLAAGALEEARAVARLGLDPDLPGMKVLGLRELMRHLRGHLSLAAAVEAAQRATRQYAKRQATWFRHQMPTARRLEPAYVDARFSDAFLNGVRDLVRHAG